jgi:hypothetical protein
MVLAATTMLGLAATSAQFAVGVTVISPCMIRVTGTPQQSSVLNIDRTTLGAPVSTSCSDGTAPLVTYDAVAHSPSIESALSAPGVTRVTISY